MSDDKNNHSAILRELSDIKSSLSVNTNETSNIKASVTEIKADVKDLKGKVEFQNGRVRTLEDWAKEAQKIIETNAKVTASYSMDKAKIWVAITLLLFLGGTIITLSIMAINSKIEKGINDALASYEINHE